MSEGRDAGWARDPRGHRHEDPPKSNRRDAGDRRARPTPVLGRYTFFGRRRQVRRVEERPGSYVDRPGAAMYALLIVVLTMSILDALFTLAHLDRGGREVNPVMDWAIGMGPVTFLVIKCLLTGSGMLLLVLHRFFGGVRIMLAAVLALYGLLMAYHLFLAIH